MYVTRGVRAASLVALVIGGSLIAGCEKASAPTPTEASSSAPATIAAPPVPPPVGWGPCPAPADEKADVVPGLQCGQLTVAVDYAKTDGATATLALIRLPATGAKIGSLITNPGGPGASGVDFLPAVVVSVPPKVRERFDLVGFDPRGVGKSRPGIDCNSDAEDDRERADPDVDYSLAGVAEIDRETKDYVQRCIDRTGEEFLDNVGTESVARDLDQLRAALGDEKLTYYGASYGTYIGSQYAELFPGKVRAMVFDAYAADCAKKADCPVGTDPARATERLHALVDPLVTAPARTADPPRASATPTRWRVWTTPCTSHGRGRISPADWPPCVIGDPPTSS